MDARFPDGTIARIDAVLRPKEARTDLIYKAVEKEIDRRETQSGSAPPLDDKDGPDKTKAAEE